MDDIVKHFLIESRENLDRLDQEFVRLDSGARCLCISLDERRCMHNASIFRGETLRLRTTTVYLRMGLCLADIAAIAG